MVLDGTVVKLDRGYPLVKTSDGQLVRCEHATALVKEKRDRAVIGDFVSISIPESHDKGIIEAIKPRRTSFTRRDPAERTSCQTLAANFDLVIIAEPLGQFNPRRLERELVLAHETGARIAVVLTKADLSSPDQAESVRQAATDLAGEGVEVLVISSEDAASIESVRALLSPGSSGILIGKSGVGKSSLVNVLAGFSVQQTSEVRQRDGRGRHTTVDRVMVQIPGGGTIVDMPGIRGLGIWDAETGISTAFPDITKIAASCRFRDCKHVDEPGCAVLEALESGALARARFESYQILSAEMEAMRVQREEARHLRGEKASDRKKKRKRR